MKTTKHILATIITTVLLGWTVPSHASLFPVGTQWNAYNDFYQAPGASGTTAPASSALGAAWGYYAANVNGSGFPTGIGAYFTPTASGSGSKNLYQYSNAAPIGAGTSVGASGYAATGGAGFAYYGDTYGWGSSLGRYSTPWFGGAPGNSQGLSNLIWMQSGWLSGGGLEGIAPVLTWTAPQTGVYAFAGQFVAGNQPANSAAIAIVDSLGSSNLLSRMVLGSNATQAFSFTASYNAGDTVQFQVGNNFSTGNAVGLQVTATAIPEPSSGMLLTAGLGALGLIHLRRRR
jgi:hypothetical protein